MLFKKLFQMLVVGGAVAGTASGCARPAEAQTAQKSPSMRDGGSVADAGVKDEASGGGVKGW